MMKYVYVILSAYIIHIKNVTIAYKIAYCDNTYRLEFGQSSGNVENDIRQTILH